MNLVKFGVDDLDRLIGGGVVQRKAYLLEHDVGTKPRFFIFPFIEMGVSSDEACRLDIFGYTHDEVVEDMMNAGFDAEEAVTSGKLAIVDYENGKIHVGEEQASIDTAGGRSGIDSVSAFRLSEECWSRIATRASAGARVVLLGVTVLFRQLGFRAAIRFIETQIRSAKNYNAVFVTDVNPRALHPVELAVLEELFDGIVELSAQWENRRLQRYVTVRDSPLPRFRRERVPYEVVIRENVAVGVSIGVALGEDFEAFKSTLALVAPGVIESQREGRMVLHYARGVRTLHRTAFELAGYEKGYEIL
jgi:KaiC/GvpD/RAD55 family RecA-like ATPase